jgi:hypothetical protein
MFAGLVSAPEPLEGIWMVVFDDTEGPRPSSTRVCRDALEASTLERLGQWRGETAEPLPTETEVVIVRGAAEVILDLFRQAQERYLVEHVQPVLIEKNKAFAAAAAARESRRGGNAAARGPEDPDAEVPFELSGREAGPVSDMWAEQLWRVNHARGMDDLTPDDLRLEARAWARLRALNAAGLLSDDDLDGLASELKHEEEQRATSALACGPAQAL